MDEEILYTNKQVAKLLKSNPNKVYELQNLGLLPYLVLGSRKVRREALLKFLEKCEGWDLSDPRNPKKIETEQVEQPA